MFDVTCGAYVSFRVVVVVVVVVELYAFDGA